jgi:hypothetical protein
MVNGKKTGKVSKRSQDEIAADGVRPQSNAVDSVGVQSQLLPLGGLPPDALSDRHIEAVAAHDPEYAQRIRMARSHLVEAQTLARLMHTAIEAMEGEGCNEPTLTERGLANREDGENVLRRIADLTGEACSLLA